MIENIKSALIAKWGYLSVVGNATVNGTPSYAEPEMHFNYIFNPVQTGRASEVAASLNLVLPDDLGQL